jgi:ATP-binding cassette subfamily B protein
MIDAIDSALWPLDRTEEALRELALTSGLSPKSARSNAPGALDAHDVGLDELAERLSSAADEIDVEIEPVTAAYARVDEFLQRAAPAILVVETASSGPRIAALLGARRGRAWLLAQDGTRVAVDRALLAQRWCTPVEGGLAAALEPVLQQASLRAAAIPRARAALLAQHLGETPVGGAWLVRLPPGRSLVHQGLHAKLGRKLGAIVAVSVLASVFALASWIVLGRGILAGELESAWIVAWILCLASSLPLRWLEGYLQADFALHFGALLRRRLLAGAARLDPQRVRGEGSGALLGRVLESEALESLVLGGGFLLIGAAIDLALATWALASAPHASIGLPLLAAWVAIALALGVRQLARSRSFATARRDLTEDLVERMVGHRTRVAQEPPELWHVEEDKRLSAYNASSRALDRSTLALTACISTGFALSSLAALGWSYVTGASAPAALAIGVGTVILGQQALSKLSSGVVQLAVCAAAWRQVAPLYEAAAGSEEPGLPRAALRPSRTAPRSSALAPPLVAARGLAFRHDARADPALERVDLAIAAGERVLVEGPSGGGKSTLASLLVGWREPTAGNVLLRGLDRRSWGAARWRARIAAAPQFHENRIFTASLAFNLLLACADDDPVAEERAAQVLRELGLGDLLARMPSGMRQLVGETGWQLSHGERSRVFIARALLARADVVVLDESLAGLDPGTARTVLDALWKRAPALVVMAHP